MPLDISLQDAYILEFYAGLDCPRSLTAWLLFKYNEHKQLVDLEFDPLHFNDLGRARDSLSATSFLSKANFLETNVDKTAVAIEKFLVSENQCSETNENIRRNRFKHPYSAAVLMGMQSKIFGILGGFSPDEFVDSCNWGPGATTLLPRRLATHPNKFSSERKITAEAYDFVKSWFHVAYPHWDVMFEIDGVSKIVTVAKNAKTDRTINIEPGINLWFQKSIGSMMRRRLKRHGIDLDDQRINQEKARLGSRFKTLATVDFSSASDMVSRELVNQTLPTKWLTLMNAFRSSVGFHKQTGPIVFQKYSSMGNGFTFELESLLFYTMAVACCDCLNEDSSEVSVYGDDVILPVAVYDLFREVSADLGFKFNMSKSYDRSYYRESCGEHFWNGSRIKPVFQKEPLSEQSSIILAANNVRRLARSRSNYGCDRALRRCYKLLVDYLGPKCPRISEGYGDVGLISNLCESEAQRASHGYEGYFVRVWSVVAAQITLSSPGLYLTRLKAAGNSTIRTEDLRSYGKPYDFWSKFECVETLAMGNQVPMLADTRHARTRLLIPRWIELGEWV